MVAYTNSLPPELAPIFTARLLAWSVPEPNSGCWLWMRAHRRGYGILDLHGYRFTTHRLSWLLFRGPIPDRHDVCHRCDTPACVNPDHLFAGTRSQNIQDAANKGRLGTQRHPEKSRGERSGMALLTNEAVTAIRLAPPSEVRALAARYGVSTSCISQVRTGRIWRHVDPPRAVNLRGVR